MKLNYACAVTAAAAMIMGANDARANMLYDLYVGGFAGFGGTVIFQDGHTSGDTAQSYGAVAGLDIPFFRIEAEYDYLDQKYANMHVGMVNGYLKMPAPLIKPYMGVGIGSIFAGDYEIDGGHSVDIDSTIAYQAMLGLTFDIPLAPINIDIEGRALYAHDVFSKIDPSCDMLQYDVRAKLRLTF